MFDEFMLRGPMKDIYYAFPVDVFEEGGNYVCQAELPGVKKEDIEVTFEDGVLSIVADKKRTANPNKYLIHERNFMKFKREINFGALAEETLSAKLENGILTVVIVPKAAKPKKTISIE